MEVNGKKAKFAWEVVKGIAIGAAAVFSFFANQSSESAKLAAEKSRLDLDHERVEMEGKSQQSQFDIKAYDLVERTLLVDVRVRKGHEIAASAIVSALTKSPLRDDLLNALRAGATDLQVVQKLDAARAFDLDEEPNDTAGSQKPTQGQSSWLHPALDSVGDVLVPPVSAQPAVHILSRYRVDIFYCEADVKSVTDARKARAIAASAQLQHDDPPARVRLRLLPSLVQVRPGYQSFADEIRFNDEGDEKQAAARLAEILGIKADAVREVPFKTPGYLSAFYCGR